MSSEVERKDLGFDEWLGEVESRSPDKVFLRIRGVKDVVVGEVYEYEAWFRDGKIDFYRYLPPQSRPYMDRIHEKLVGLGYAVYGFGECRSEVIVLYRRGRDNGMRVYPFGVDDEKRPCCGGGFHRLMSWLRARTRPRI